MAAPVLTSPGQMAMLPWLPSADLGGRTEVPWSVARGPSTPPGTWPPPAGGSGSQSALMVEEW